MNINISLEYKQHEIYGSSRLIGNVDRLVSGFTCQMKFYDNLQSLWLHYVSQTKKF